jgi:hypothetical protein
LVERQRGGEALVSSRDRPLDPEPVICLAGSTLEYLERSRGGEQGRLLARETGARPCRGRTANIEHVGTIVRGHGKPVWVFLRSILGQAGEASVDPRT